MTKTDRLAKRIALMNYWNSPEGKQRKEASRRRQKINGAKWAKMRYEKSK